MGKPEGFDMLKKIKPIGTQNAQRVLPCLLMVANAHCSRRWSRLSIG
jgi:hypothetical protein